MRCRDVDRLASAYIDAELDEARASALRGHLRVCQACLSNVEDLAAIRDGASRLEPLDPPPSLWSQIEAGLAEAEIADSNRSWLWLRWQAIQPKLLPGAVAACAAALLVLWLVEPGVDSAPSEGQEIASASHSADESAPEPGPSPTESAPSVVGPAVLIDDASGQEFAAHGLGAPVDESADFFEARGREVKEADHRYRSTIDELLEMVGEERKSWPQELGALFDRRLATFARAADQQKQLLVASNMPSPESRDRLYAVYRAEIEFLQTVVVDGVVREAPGGGLVP